jgi:hypothetical protein
MTRWKSNQHTVTVVFIPLTLQFLLLSTYDTPYLFRYHMHIFSDIFAEESDTHHIQECSLDSTEC